MAQTIACPHAGHRVYARSDRGRVRRERHLVIGGQHAHVEGHGTHNCGPSSAEETDGSILLHNPHLHPILPVIALPYAAVLLIQCPHMPPSQGQCCQSQDLDIALAPMLLRRMPSKDGSTAALCGSIH